MLQVHRCASECVRVRMYVWRQHLGKRTCGGHTIPWGRWGICGGPALGVASQALCITSKDRIFHWPGTHQKGEADFPTSPRVLPASTFPALGSQVSTTMPMGSGDQIQVFPLVFALVTGPSHSPVGGLLPSLFQSPACNLCAPPSLPIPYPRYLP